VTPELAKLLERMRQRREQPLAEGMPPRSSGVSLTSKERPSMAAGARVFDPVTGQVGEVIGGGSENVVIPTTK